MAGFMTTTSQHLIRSTMWSSDLKEFFMEDLIGMKYVRMITDLPDGDTVNIPSIGQAEVLDYVEGQPVKYTMMDTGNFTFSINQYKQSATYITEKMLQDSYYSRQLVASFVPKQHRAIMKAMEIDIMNIGPDGQTASDLNSINGAAHRFVASGTNETLSIKDFTLARYALQKANVPMTNLVAIVDPSVEFAFANTANIVNLSYNPNWEGIVRTGITTGMRFAFNIMGFDVYVNQNLKSGIAETINGRSVTTGVANIFFSASNEQDQLPFVGLVRQPPKVDSEYNKDFQREEYVTTARWGFKLYRPENLVVILSDTDQVS